VERKAWVRLDGWSGAVCVEGVVIGETPKRYRFRWGRNAYGRTAGAVSLVPKYAVAFRRSADRP